MGGEPGAPTAKRVAVQTAVLEATEALLAEGTSYPELKIERIATRAGISRTAFYFYFRDKRELLLRLTEDVSQKLYTEGDLRFTSDDDPSIGLGRAIRNSAELYQQHRDVLRAVADAATTDDEMARFWHGILDRFIDATLTRIEAEQKAGRGIQGDPRATAFALCWMTERTFHQQAVLGNPIAQEDLLDALTAIWARVIYGT